jgi:hypothetical protein
MQAQALSSEDLTYLFANIDEVCSRCGMEASMVYCIEPSLIPIRFAELMCVPLLELREKFEGAAMTSVGSYLRRAFAHLDPDVFAQFCVAQRHALQYYQQKAKTTPGFDDMFKAIETRKECQRLTYSDFIAKVIRLGDVK